MGLFFFSCSIPDNLGSKSRLKVQLTPLALRPGYRSQGLRRDLPSFFMVKDASETKKRPHRERFLFST